MLALGEWPALRLDWPIVRLLSGAVRREMVLLTSFKKGAGNVAKP